jgi:hypothetical protein
MQGTKRPPVRPYRSAVVGGYVNFNAEGLTAAAGYHMMSAAQLERYRHAVNAGTEGAPLAQVVSGLRQKGSRSVAARPSRALHAGTPRTIPGSNCSVTRA